LPGADLLWSKSLHVVPQLFNFKYSIPELLAAVFCFLAFLYGLFLIISASQEINHKTNSKKERQPSYLIQNGPYAKVRHPMYTGFILVETGLWFSLHSPYGYVIGLLLTGLFLSNGPREEKTQLIPIFGEKYRQYAYQVKRRYFTKISFIFLLFAYVSPFILLL
jgi:protein-S-isoprenylcysteine O-methyltransferase Ste14